MGSEEQREAALADPRGPHDGLGSSLIASFYDHTYAGVGFPMPSGHEPSYTRHETISGSFHLVEWREDWRGQRFAAVLGNEDEEDGHRWVVFDLAALQEIER